MNMTCRCVPRSRVPVFRATLADAGRGRGSASVSDPTGTLPIVRRFNKDADARWAKLRKLLPDALRVRLSAVNVFSHSMMTGQDPVRAFQSWMDEAMRQVVLGTNGSWLLRYVRDAGDLGSNKARAMVQDTVLASDAFNPRQPRDKDGQWTTVYHGTGSQFVESILKTGINKSKSQEHLGVSGVFVGSKKVAAHFAEQNVGVNEITGKRTKPVVLELRVPKQLVEEADEDQEAKRVGKRGLALKRRIPKEWIVKVHDADTLVMDAVPRIDRIPVLQSLAHTEMQGIIEAVSQKCVRIVADGIMLKKTPAAMAREMQQVVDKTGIHRTRLLIDFIAVRAHNATTLDVFRAAGIRYVDTVAERTGLVSPLPQPPGLVRDAKKKKSKPKNLVNVLTAGDDKVCPTCEDISEEGPYSLDEAERLIPAHPRCRCAFIPWGDKRYAKDEKWDESEHPRAPKGTSEGGQFTKGGKFSRGSEQESSSSSASSSAPKKKSKKIVKVEDFDKAKITLNTSDANKVIEKWNAEIGMDPEEFKKSFLGNVPATMKVSLYNNSFEVKGALQDARGNNIGTYNRTLSLDKKSAYSEYFQLNRDQTGGDIGKKVLAGNVEMYEQLGVEKVSVTANIDVGGYAWAKYGYVPTQSSWNDLRGSLERSLTRGGSPSSTRRSANTMEADDWGMLSSDQQERVRDHWMSETRNEFVESEVNNWRDNGGALNEAKGELADEFTNNQVTTGDLPDWIDESINATREYLAENEKPEIPYTNRQIYDAMELQYESDGEGRNDPEIGWDDKMLAKPKGFDPDQGTLPGIEPIQPHEFLTADMRERLVNRMVKSFNDKAEENADDVEPPSYIFESVDEYQDEYWDSMSESEMLQRAIDYDMADVELPEDEDDEEEAELDLEEKTPPAPDDPLLVALRSSDPKSIWKVADTERGKRLLLGKSWSGVLNLKDPESMERFKKYVGRAK